MKKVHMLTCLLVWVGALNWGMVGLFDGFNLVTALVGQWPLVEKAVYILVGVSALFEVVTHKNNCKACGA